MAVKLLNYVKDQFSDKAIASISSMIGENSSVTKSAIFSSLPTLLKGVINKGSTEEKARGLKRFISDEKLGSNLMSTLLAAGTQSDKDAFVKKGAGVVDYLFGSDKNVMLDTIGKAAGLGANKSSMLTSAIAPLVLNFVSKFWSKQKFSEAQFASYLDGQRSHITKGGVTKKATPPPPPPKREPAPLPAEKKSGPGMLLWILPLALLGLLGWWFMGRSSSTTTSDNTTTTSTTTTPDRTTSTSSSQTSTAATTATDAVQQTTTAATNAVQSATTAATNAGETATNAVNEVASKATDMIDGITLDANGNLVDANGKIIAKAGEFEEKDGYYVGKDGKRIGLLKKIGKAIDGAATKTADAFNKVFTDIFKSKEKVGSTYGLSKIVFDDKSHKITDFSKAEVEGLANALKALPKAEIEVQVYSTDGKNAKENEKFTKLRAEVVHDMLVTLGVNKKQISFKGMGKSNAAKAASEKVEIMVKQIVE